MRSGVSLLAPTLMPTRPPACARRQPPQHRLSAFRIKTEPVDHAFIGIKPEQPRPRIAGLRLWRDGADFDEAEADAKERIRHLGVLVESGCDPDRVWEVEPEHA